MRHACLGVWTLLVDILIALLFRCSSDTLLVGTFNGSSYLGKREVEPSVMFLQRVN